MAKFPHLVNRKGYYYFRIAVPTQLISKLACKELSCSLRTKTKHEAQYKALQIERGIQLIFMELETGTQLTPQEVKVIVKAYFKEALSRLERQMEASHKQAAVLHKMKSAAVANSKEADKQKLNRFDVASYQERMDYLVPADYSFPKEDSGKRIGANYEPFFFNGDPKTVLSYVLDENKLLELNDYAPSYKALEKGVNRAIIELQHQHQRFMGFETDVQINDDWFKDSKLSQNSRSSHNISDASESPHISAVFEEFIKGRADEQANTLAQKQSSLSLWVEMHGDTRITEISASKVRDFKNKLSQLPKNRDKAKAYKGKTLDELFKMNIPQADLMSVGTKNGYMGTMSTFMNWLADEYSEYNIENHFSGKRFVDKARKKDKRNPFSEEQLKALFQTPIYKGCAGGNQVKRYEEGNTIIKDSLYWVPLVALYTGARMEEILRLRPVDFSKEDGVWVFDINEESGRSLKTIKSKRKIPVHKDLIALGVLEKRNTDKKLLFCDTPMSKQGKYSKEYSKKFARVLDRYKIKTDKTNFHSFRHNFKDALLEAGVYAMIATIYTPNVALLA